MPQVGKLAIQQLDDPAPSVARDATQALQHYGSAAENGLWARLEKLHQQWKDKPDELLHPRPNMFVYDRDSGLEQALVQGISLGQAWFADAATIQRLKELSSPAMQNELDGTLQMLRRWRIHVGHALVARGRVELHARLVFGRGHGEFQGETGPVSAGFALQDGDREGCAGGTPGRVCRGQRGGFGKRPDH